MTAPSIQHGPTLGSTGVPGQGKSPLGRRVPPPLRQNNQPDGYDSERSAYYWSLYRSQDTALLQRDRQIEENVRMLCGQQWAVFSPFLNRFFDISEWMSDAEKRWRQRPVINHLLKWFIITHARLTENAPILTFVPGPDALDAQLAEVMDTAFKITWRDANMADVVDRIARWAVPGGGAYALSHIDLHKGPWKPWSGQAVVPMVAPVMDESTGQASYQPILGPNGQPARQMANGVPFAKDGTPLGALDASTGQIVPDPFAPPGLKQHAEREGQIAVDVLSPLEARGQWGPKPWYEKRWHGREAYYTPSEIYETWGVELSPETTFEEANAGILDRLMFGSGYYGASSGRGTGASSGGSRSEARDGLVRVVEIWEAPCDYGIPGLEALAETPDNPGGRHIALTKTTVLQDGPREVRYPYVSPISYFPFVQVPGRPSGTSPQESLNGPQRSYNKLRSQVMEHANLVSNPKFVVDRQSGIDEGQWTNEPGKGVSATMRPSVVPVQYVVPPTLGADVYNAIEFAKNEIEDLGALKGAQGEQADPNQSGEAIKELRFNSDRYLGPTTRRWVEEFSRMAETWQPLLAIIWDEERVLSLAGTDNIATTVMVLPHLFQQGKVNVIPDVESMLPEGRGERQSQAYAMWKDGAFGPPLSPQATGKMLELGRFPHLSRLAKPGGPDATAAEQENGQLSLGTPAVQIPLYPWQDDAAHLMTHERVMKSPEFKKLPPPVQQQYAIHWGAHKQRYEQMIMAQQAAMAAQQANANGGPPSGGPGSKGASPTGRSEKPPQQQEHAATPRASVQPQPATPPSGAGPMPMSLSGALQAPTDG